MGHADVLLQLFETWKHIGRDGKNLRTNEKVVGKTLMKYLIHAVPKRMWYVNEYLIPSLVNQGISRYNVIVYEDTEKLGNLKAFTEACKTLKEDAWHLQDDICISRRFKGVTETVEGVACGFCSVYSQEKTYGIVGVEDMWYSFPCIRIPVKYSNEFLEWLDTEALQNPKYKSWIQQGRYDDSLFMEFMLRKHGNTKVTNIAPNIVNHIDYLIGGSIVNKIRSRDASSIYWNEPEVLQYWKETLKCRL